MIRSPSSSTIACIIWQRPRCSTSVRRLHSPKSSSTGTAPRVGCACTRMFPACASLLNTPSQNIWRAHASQTRSTSCSRSTPRRASACGSLRLSPSQNSITSTFSVVHSETTRGTTTGTRRPARLLRTSTRLLASCRKSSSFACSRLISVRMGTKSKCGSRTRSTRASTKLWRRSWRRSGAMSWCCTLTATLSGVSPSRCSQPTCTWAIEPHESAFASSDLSLRGAAAPHASTNVSTVCRVGRCGLLSSMRLRCATTASGTKSERLARYWPVFIQ
mmetsp:Transcript_39128/g.91543  ORF Transcript_39128/g.91543 Transcript_39128/m.91543 type:complete len:275 (-) Transcript_39128:663-1487(-)